MIDVDPEQAESQLLKNQPLYQVTPDDLVVGSQDNITIEVHKTTPIYDDQTKGYRNRWRAFATNHNPTTKCIMPVWRLMDFEYVSWETSEFAVYPNKLKFIGEMIQKTWIIDGVKVAPPSSGYLYKLLVRNPEPNSQPGDECIHLINEKDIEEQ